MDKSVNSLHTFLHAIEIHLEDHKYRNTDEILLYRGQYTGAKLLPKIARELDELNQTSWSRKKTFIELENEMFNTFKRKLVPYVQKIPESDIDLLAIGQHYGLTTRLLDWTENPLVALFFAGNNGTVWILRIKKDNIIDLKKELNPFIFEDIKIFRPSLLDNRLISQNGWFTLHPFNKEDNCFVPMEELDLYKSTLKHIKINSKNIIDQLDVCNINTATLFPDISGLSKYLSNNWSQEMFVRMDPSQVLIEGERRKIKAPKIRSLLQSLSYLE